MDAGLWPAWQRITKKPKGQGLGEELWSWIKWLAGKALPRRGHSCRTERRWRDTSSRCPQEEPCRPRETQGQRPRDWRCLVYWRNYREARERGPEHTELLHMCACLLSTRLWSMYLMYYFMPFLQKPGEVGIKFLLHRWKHWCSYSALFWQQWTRNPNSKPFPQHGNDLDKHLLPHLKFS